MCNRLENGMEIHPIPKNSYGYKLFLKNRGYSRFLTPPYRSDRRIKVGAWVKWDSGQSGDGFCFLKTLKDVKEFRMGWLIGCSVYKIQYKNGLGKRLDDFNNYTMSLCKEYKILEKII